MTAAVQTRAQALTPHHMDAHFDPAHVHVLQMHDTENAFELSQYQFLVVTYSAVQTPHPTLHPQGEGRQGLQGEGGQQCPAWNSRRHQEFPQAEAEGSQPRLLARRQLRQEELRLEPLPLVHQLEAARLQRLHPVSRRNLPEIQLQLIKIPVTLILQFTFYINGPRPRANYTETT
jgi:hypothetical protein